ncbi:MAG: hypothetical protein N3G21_09600 [Candidatus Hydrogenedentes bacterium]|nr:hypothetical protein [Candidatus Hydrogenedentota bacterium]
MEIRIRKNSPNCFNCSKNFEHEEDVWSQLIKRNDEFERQDFCISCWSEKKSNDVFSYWKHKYIDPKVIRKTQKLQEDSPLRKLFYDIVSKSETRREEAIAYLTSQLLRREKIFKRIKELALSKTDGHIIIYVDRLDERVVEVRDPNFSYPELEEARKYIREFLDSNANSAIQGIE